MYDPLYTRLAEFEEREGEGRDGSGPHTPTSTSDRSRVHIRSASYDLISTHTKYAPSQRQWLTHSTTTWTMANWNPSLPARCWLG